MYTAWKVSKYGVVSGMHFPVFSPNTGKYGPEITPNLDTFYIVVQYITILGHKSVKRSCRIQATAFPINLSNTKGIFNPLLNYCQQYTYFFLHSKFMQDTVISLRATSQCHFFLQCSN